MNKCNFCGNKKFIELFKTQDSKTNRTFSILGCYKCDLAFTSPLLGKKDLIKYYLGYRDDSNRRFWKPIEKFIYFWHKNRVSHVMNLVDKGKILDVGCGRALELEMLKKKGWSIFATEFSKDIKKSLLKKGLRLFFNEIWELKNKNNFFDIVTLWHSLEHLSDPQRVIKTAKKLLKKNGYLIIGVPNFSSVERKLFGKFWFHLDIPRHLYHFPKETLIKYLENNDFKIISKKYIAPEYDFFSFWQGSINKIFPNYPNIIYRYLSRGSRLRLYEKAIILSQLPILTLIIIVSFFVVPFLWLTKQSGTIEITCRK